jgi:glycosyltransferase involved in cell wall biosynthesis
MHLLSLIIPIGPMSDEFSNMKSWLFDFSKQNTQIIFSLGTQDSQTVNAFNKLLKDLSQIQNNVKIQVVYSQGKGPGSARNAGLEKASGKWIAFWDSDDVPNTNAFFEMIEKAESNSCDVIFGGYVRKDGPNRNVIKENLYVGNISQQATPLLLLNPGIWRYAFRRDFLSETRFEPWNMAEDQDYLAQVLTLGGKVMGVGEIVYLYDRSHPQQLTKSPSALSDLLLSQAKNASYSLKYNNSNTIWILLLCKQSITAVRTLPYGKKLVAIRVFLGTFGRMKFSDKLAVLRYLLRITLNWKSQNEK